MNLILLEASELDAAGVVTLRGDRARHLLEVLGAEPGRNLRVGVVDGPLGSAEVETTEDGVRLRCQFEGTAPARTHDSLLLAMPRPVVLRRVLEHATAVGFGRIVLFRTWRVDRAFLDSGATDPTELRKHLLIGLAQARRTQLPRVLVYPLFKPFVEDELNALIPSVNRYVADPDALQSIGEHPPTPGPFTLAIGPERGFTEYEVEKLGELGFAAVHAGRHPLRVEAAVVALHARLDALRGRA